MKICILGLHESYEIGDLQAEAKKGGVKVIRVAMKTVNLSDISQTEHIDEALSSDIVLLRSGPDLVARPYLINYLTSHGVYVINANTFKNPHYTNKVFLIAEAKKNNILVPKTLSLMQLDPDDYTFITKNLGDPFIVKPADGSKGIGVSLVHTKQEYISYIQSARASSYLAQEYIENDGDYRIFVVGNKSIAGYKRVPAEGEFRANISQGGSGVSISDEKTKQTLFDKGQEVAKVFDIEMTGIDFIISSKNQQVYFTELNRTMQWGGLKAALDFNVAKEVLTYLQLKVH